MSLLFFHSTIRLYQQNRHLIWKKNATCVCVLLTRTKAVRASVSLSSICVVIHSCTFQMLDTCLIGMHLAKATWNLFDPLCEMDQLFPPNSWWVNLYITETAVTASTLQGTEDATSDSPCQVRNHVAVYEACTAMANMPILCMNKHCVNSCLNHRIKSVEVNYIIIILGLQKTELNLDLKWWIITPLKSI